MDFITREQDGLIVPRDVTLISASAGIFGHWTAGPTSQTVREIQRFHMETRGWNDIAYSWLVDEDGDIHEGRGWGVAGAHTQGFNTVSHAVCAIVGDDAQVTEGHLEGMAIVMQEHDRIYGRGFHLPHREAMGASTFCPGDTITTWIHNQGWTQTTPEGFTMEQMDTIAGWFHDTRRLILAGQIADAKAHRKSLVAEWRTRNKIMAELTGQPQDTAKPAAITEVEERVHSLERKIAELDTKPCTLTEFDDNELVA